MIDTSAPAATSLLDAGDLAPWFKAPVLGGRPDWAFASAAGAPVLLFFMGSAGHPGVAAALGKVLKHRASFSDATCRFFAVTCDPQDAAGGRIKANLPGIRYFLDYDRAISTMYGAGDTTQPEYRPHLLLLDRTLQVVRRYWPGTGRCGDRGGAGRPDERR